LQTANHSIESCGSLDVANRSNNDQKSSSDSLLKTGGLPTSLAMCSGRTECLVLGYIAFRCSFTTLSIETSPSNQVGLTLNWVAANANWRRLPLSAAN